MKLWGQLGPLRAVVVTTKTDRTMRGLLVHQARDHIVMRAVSIHQTDKQGGFTWQKMDGDVVILVENIDYWQEGLDPAAVLT